MFTADDLLSLTDYFDILSTDGETYFEIMSKNTTHYWKVLQESWGFLLYHAHTLSDGYHLHGEFVLLLDCILEIVEHDEWKLNIWRYKNIGKRKQSNTYFDKLMDKYVILPEYA